ncbi:MAG TPA: serine hydrolase [Rhodanobacteraceae bacterium]|nr:serine hydrolase [Rhodanobacteraceae bacterium]
MRPFAGVLACFAMLPMATAPAAATPTPLLSPRVDKAIEARIAAGEYPALVVAVIDGERSHVYGFGTLANGAAPDGDTVFEIGSLTKTFTATLLAQALTAGPLTLDTPVAKLLPGFTIPARDGKRITLGELATQFSGLPRLPGNLRPADPHDPYADYDAADLKSFLAGYTLSRDPGAKYEYSNLGFGLLGYALAQHAGTTYGDLLQTRILKPLGMHSSGIALDAAMRSHLAPGQDSQGQPAGTWSFGALAGCGAIKSSGSDMLRYLRANMRADAALHAAMALAQQPRRDLGQGERIGLAWMTRHTPHGDIVWHNGMTGGYASFMGFSGDGQRGVVVLTSTQRSVDDIGFAMLLPDSPLAAAQTQVKMDAQQLDAYVGQYRLSPRFVLKVFRGDDQLYAQATGQGAFPIFPSARDAFFAKVAAIRIDFQRGDDGKVASLVLHQNGHDSPAPKLSEAELEKSGEPKAVQLDAATLQQYVGHYQLVPGMVFDISVKRGQLMARLSGQPALPVQASARDEFFYTAVDARLSFKRDAKGKITALVLHQNGMERRAPRIGD